MMNWVRSLILAIGVGLISLTYSEHLITIFQESYPGELNIYCPLIRLLIQTSLSLLLLNSRLTAFVLITIQTLLAFISYDPFVNLNFLLPGNPVGHQLATLITSNDPFLSIFLDNFVVLTLVMFGLKSGEKDEFAEYEPDLGIGKVASGELREFKDKARRLSTEAMDKMRPQVEKFKQEAKETFEKVKPRVEELRKEAGEMIGKAEKYVKEHVDIEHDLVPEAFSENTFSDREDEEVEKVDDSVKNVLKRSKEADVLKQAREEAARLMQERTKQRIEELKRRRRSVGPNAE